MISGNIVRMAFYLVMSLGAVAGLFFLAGADFLGGLQLMVYVGGTMVLLVFGVMLTARGPLVQHEDRAGQWILAAIVGGSLLAVLLQIALGVGHWAGDDRSRTGILPVVQVDRGLAVRPPTAAPLGLGLLGVRVDQQEENDRRADVRLLLAFEIISVHLVVVLIGAAYLARAKRPAAESGGDRGASPAAKPQAN